MVYIGEKMLNDRSYLTVFDRPFDVSSIARGLGVRAWKATTLDEFATSLRSALKAQEPCLIEVVVDLEEVPRALQQRADTLKAFFGKQEA